MTDTIGLIVLGKENVKIPLDSVSIQANIYGLLAHFEAAFAYTNSTQNPIEVEFKHPLHSDSVLVGIEAVVDGKVIKGIVKEKGEAKAVYEDAIASGETAVLVNEETQDIIGISLGNLAPGKKAEVRLKLLQQMQVEEQGIHLLLPTTLKPRYELASEPGASRQAPPMTTPFPAANTNIVAAVYKFSFELFIMTDIGKLKQINSPSHPLEEFVSTDGRKGMQLTSLDPLNTDLVVYIDYEDIHPLSAMIEPALPASEEKPAQHPFIDNPAVLLTFMPKSSGADVSICGEYIFVIDQSGSMSGGPILNARETLDMLLRSLSPGSFFNIIGFGTSFHSLFPQSSVEYTQKSLDKAVQHVKSLTANLGGTEILQPLKHIYSSKPARGLARQIFLLTDGEVSNTATVVKTVADNAHNSRVFTFGIGSGVSTDLVNNVARAGKGKAVFISGKDRMQSRVMEAMNIAMSPSYTDISVTGSKQMAVYPKSIPVLFENEPFVVVAFFTEKIVKGEKMTATLKYSSDKETKATTVEFTLSDSVTSLSPHLPAQLVHQFGVSKALRDLEGGISCKEECITLSCYANILCKHTAFVAVSEDQQRVVEGPMKVYTLKTSSVYMDMIGGFGSPSPQLLGACSKNLQSRPISRGAPPNAPKQRKGGAPPFNPPRSRRAAAPIFMDSAPQMQMMAPPPPPMDALSDMAADYEDMDEDMDANMAIDSAVDSAEFESDYMPPQPYASISAPASAPSSKPSPMGHQSIMALQRAEGNWEHSEEIEELLACKDLKKSCPDAIKDLKIWVTLLCIACLQMKFQEFKSEWQLVSKKAERWVHSKVQKGNYQNLLELATNSLQK